MPLPRSPIDLARRGAWSAETTHVPRVPDVAVAAHRRAQPISKTFPRGVTSARALSVMTPVGARRCGQHSERDADGTISARTKCSTALDRFTTHSRLSARSSSVGSRSQRGDGQRAATKLCLMAPVGARRCGQRGARDARWNDRRTDGMFNGARSKNGVLAISARLSSSCGLEEPARR